MYTICQELTKYIILVLTRHVLNNHLVSFRVGAWEVLYLAIWSFIAITVELDAEWELSCDGAVLFWNEVKVKLHYTYSLYKYNTSSHVDS